MSEDIVIGKHTLESLTSGMYSDPYVVFREYVQNSADSIDEAVEKGVITLDESQINICLMPNERKIVIGDNGLGIPNDNAEKILISIGNSKKNGETSRGFRGIGRLAALSYCTNLTFETSYRGEKIGTRISIDAHKLALLLSKNDEADVTVVDVLKSVYSVETYAERETQHYFRVVLEGVDETSDLNNYEAVADYLAQNIPVPYDPERFVWGREIIGRLKREGITLKAYNVSLSYGTKTVPIFKSYKDEFLVDKGKNLTDKITNIEIIKITSSSRQLLAIGWIGSTGYLGSIYDKSVKGLRLRKGNILIGDAQTMNIVFKDARFNGWSVGEIFAVDSSLIPNARRDNFEKNPSYFMLLEQMTTLAASITKDIRAASLQRNTDLSKALAQVGTTSKNAENALDAGITSSQKGSLKQKLVLAQEQLANAHALDDTDEYYQDIAFDEIDMLIGKLNGATSYKALNTLSNLSNTEKRILEKVFNIILGSQIHNGSDVVDLILNEFCKER